MKKVSINIAKALMKNEGEVFGNSFTKVDSLMSEGGVYLHNNKIMWWENNHPSKNLSNNIHLCFSMCGWGHSHNKGEIKHYFFLCF
jgi:hypothetical protein